MLPSELCGYDIRSSQSTNIHRQFLHASCLLLLNFSTLQISFSLLRSGIVSSPKLRRSWNKIARTVAPKSDRNTEIVPEKLRTLDVFSSLFCSCAVS